MWLRLASKCADTTWVDTLAAESAVDPVHWVRERVDAVCSTGARGPLYIFIREPPDGVFADTLGWIAADRRLEPMVVAPATALTAREHIELIQRWGARALYVTPHGTADTPAARWPEAWRPALRVLATTPRLIPRVRVGMHLLLSPASVRDVSRVVELASRIEGMELLLWDAGCAGMEAEGLEPDVALRALDAALLVAQQLGVRVRPVGFERTRAVASRTSGIACVASGAILELLRDGIPLPSARAGILATSGDVAAIGEAVSTGRAAAQLAFEFAASGNPFLDLPACLGGMPPEHARPQPGSIKVDACRQCPIDSTCAGAPRPMMEIPGVESEIGAPRHWMALPEPLRALVLCPIVTDALYGATFFSLARALARQGAHVDVVSPWAIHTGISPWFTKPQPIDRPEGASEVERYVTDGPLDRYGLIVTPDLQTARVLVASRRLRAATRLAATDFHLLWGMDEWVRDLCGPGRRPEEGGWWPSDQVVLYSAFPGYARLYRRYGVPLRQVVWQPYALDPASFPVEAPATEGDAIISAGRHLRDLDTLLAAAALLTGDVHPIDLFAEGEVRSPPRHIRFHGTVPSSVFCPGVGRSRFMVVPLLEDPHKPAGVTALATAIMCGRPIVASATAAARDYVVDGVNGLLVPPGDAKALAQAIRRLDTDPALLAVLAKGACNAAEHLTTERWARVLLHGSRMHDTEHWMWAKWRGHKAHLSDLQ